MMISPVWTGYLADVTGTFKWSFVLGGFISFVVSAPVMAAVMMSGVATGFVTGGIRRSLRYDYVFIC
jgi:hypothetical protein